MRVGEREAPCAGRAEPSRGRPADSAARVAAPEGHRERGKDTGPRDGPASAAPAPAPPPAAARGRRSRASGPAVPALRGPQQGPARPGPARRHRNHRSHHRNYRKHREGARDIREQKPERASSNPRQPGEAVAEQSYPDNKPQDLTLSAALPGARCSRWRMMLLCAAGGLVCHRPEERSGAIGRVNYLPCCSELFALFPFPVNKFLSLTLNFFKCQSEDTVLGNALPCTIFRKQLEEKMSSGIRTVLLYLSLPSRPCNANAPSAEGTPQHDEANPPCRGAGPKLLAPARGF
nr:uncharacterized protein LOC102062690 [Zonotrichia albicollis]